jgi:ribosomal 30S subunit maturation factor RimM
VTAGERLVVGQIRGFHGLRGTVRVEPLTDRAEERFAVGRTLYREGGDA